MARRKRFAGIDRGNLENLPLCIISEAKMVEDIPYVLRRWPEAHDPDIQEILFGKVIA